MKKFLFNSLSLALLAWGLNSCSDDTFDRQFQDSESCLPMKITLGGEISQVNKTRVNDNGFCNNDVVGVFIVDYDGSNPGELLLEGNRGDNIRFTFDEGSNQWNSSYDVYWKDSKTHIDVYGLYPYNKLESISNQPFAVKKDQRSLGENGELGGYESSDFLWAKASDVAPTDRTITLTYNHKMAGVRVSLVEGKGFASGEWMEAAKDILIMNTVHNAEINIATGLVTATGSVEAAGIIPYKQDNDFRAIVVPQVVKAGIPIITVTVGGKSYPLVKDSDVEFSPSKQHNFTITVDKRTDSGYDIVLSSESITAWENDNVSHDASTREYIIINVAEPGTLDKCIMDANKDMTKLENLKLTGKINSRDFAIMRYKMERLKALNLKEVQIMACEEGDIEPEKGYAANEDNEIPGGAMSSKYSLTNLVLPDKLKKIGAGAFNDCMYLTGSLLIPEGVEVIENAAFWNCKSFHGTLSLPSTLKRIGTEKGYLGYWDGTFAGCQFMCELKIPDSVVEIGLGAFNDCRGFYGELRLPEKLEKIGESAFNGCLNMTGSIEIPQGVTKIPDNCFNNCGFNGNLILHDGITVIGTAAFANTGLKGELRLPKNLEVLSEMVFYNCDFSGELILPSVLRTIGERCFAYNWRLMGTLEIPEHVLTIGAGAFANCRSIEGVIFPKDLEGIRYEPSYFEDGGAFQNCFGIGRIVCLGTIPAYVQEGAFNGVAKDNFTLEVPEASVHQYQAAVGWKDFKRIAAYRNLVIRPAIANAINTQVTRDLVLNADEDWIVTSCPDWVSLDKTSGKGKTELKLTFSPMPKGSDMRKGNVVFKLKDKDYTTTCVVTQYDYEYDEDQILTLQEATKGKGINIVLLGDGYNAKDVSEGLLLKNINEAMNLFFDIEPYKSYRDYFNVYTGISVSAESGIGSVNTIIYTRFNTTAKGGVTLSGRNGDSDFNEIMKYAMKAPTVDGNNLDQTLIIMIPNTTDYGGICYMYDGGLSIAYCPMSDYGYPLDFRGVIQHEAGGHGFGHLGDEYIYHNAFIDACGCNCCDHVKEFNNAKAMGWYDNMSLSGKMNEVPWSHLIFHEKYNQIVDIFEGGFMHNRGVYRSEQNSCMNNDIPYYSTISRESIVKRIKNYAGETYSFEEFVANDVFDGTITTNTRNSFTLSTSSATQYQHAPVFMGKRPQVK